MKNWNYTEETKAVLDMCKEITKDVREHSGLYKRDLEYADALRRAYKAEITGEMLELVQLLEDWQDSGFKFEVDEDENGNDLGE